MAEKKTTSKKTGKVTEVKTADQMRLDLLEKQNDLAGYKKGHRTGELTNPRAITATRKEIARLKTSTRLSELNEAKEDK
jgi:ribosomal protein L29